MDIHFHEHFLKVLNAPSTDALRDLVQQAVEMLGFQHYMYLLSLQDRSQPDGQRIFSLATYPAEWIEIYTANRYYLIDPAASHIRQHHYPLPWCNETFRSPKAAKMYAEARRFGISAGVTCPIVTQHKDIAGFGYAKAGDADECFADSVRSMPYGHLLASYMHEAVLRLLELHPAPRNKELTPREAQCLNLAALGINDGEIAERLGMNIRTVRFHLSNVREKLGASTRTQMIARGIEINAIGL